MVDTGVENKIPEPRARRSVSPRFCIAPPAPSHRPAMGRRVVPPPPPPGVLEVVTAYVVTHVDMAKLAVVTEMRKMTPGDKDTVVAGVFVLAMLLAQVTLVVLARFIARAVAGGPKEVEEPVSAQVAGLAWMMSAGITQPEKA